MVEELKKNLQQERTDRIHEKLRRELGPDIAQLLIEPTVIEIMLNSDGKVWVERLGEGMVFHSIMAPAQAESLMATVAASLRTTITRENPVLECELPLDGSRFEALIPPIVATPVFTIRRKATRIFTLADYVSSSTLTQRQSDLITEAIIARKNILIVGGTGTGKTTLTNAIIARMVEVAGKDRLVIIEDTAEIQCSAENTVILRTSDVVDMQRLLRSTMRLRPDRILVGEVRGAEALSLLKAWNTGHPGGIATIHANNAGAGLIRLEQLVAEATTAPMQTLIAEAVNLVISIVKTNKGRRVEEVIRVDGHDGRQYITTKIE